MKRSVTLALAATCMLSALSAQELAQGKKLVYEMLTYPLSFESDMSMITGDTKYKTKNAQAFNEKIAKGKIEPKSKSRVTSHIVSMEGSGQSATWSVTVEGLGSASVPVLYRFRKDSLTISYYNGRMAFGKDSTGMMVFGAIQLPLKPVAGTRIKGTSNASIMADKEQLPNIRKGFATPFDPAVTSSGAFFESFMNATGFKATFYNLQLVQPPEVLREEKFSLGGKEYTAYVLGTETWMKGSQTLEKSFYEMEQTYLQSPDMSKPALKTPSFEPGGKRAWSKKPGEAMDVNTYGFMPSYKEEWFVPSLGMVKSINYDGNGCILSSSVLTSIE